MKVSLLHLVSSASLLSIVASQATYDCNVGCSLDASLMGPPVCGEDNLTYLNECLAVCQNITVASLGVCEGEDPFQESFVSSDPQVIPMSTMTRFVDYRFVGKRLPSTNFEEDIRYLLEEQMINETDDDFLEEMDDQFIPNYRFTPEGYEYRTTLMFEEEALLQPVAPQLGLLGENGLEGDGENDATRKRRELVLIGQDSRTPVADTTRYPFRTIANADYWWGEGGCSLTLISRTSALTAGHCVWNTNRKAPMNMTAIAPARFRDATKRDGTAEPFGTWEVDYVSLFGNFQQFGHTNFDIAVVTYKPRIRNNLSTCRELYVSTSGFALANSRLLSHSCSLIYLSPETP
jgi:V8-like Glu-specific endopeptidase